MAHKHKTKARKRLAPNGRRPTTLRPPIRANPSTRGFAGGRNVAEVERAHASVTKPGEPTEDNPKPAQI
jgi:hypothetical protein